VQIESQDFDLPRRQLMLATCAVGWAVLVAATATQAQPPPDADLVLRRFLARPDEPVIRYESRWRLEAENPRFGLSGRLVASVSLHPGSGFAFVVTSESGSGRVRRHLTELLEKERSAHAEGLVARSSLTAENYDFSPAGPVEDGHRLAVRPRRREDRLVEGFVVVRAEDAELLRLEGRLVKRPSFWTREVRIVREYGRVAGQRVPLVHRATARMLVAGVSRLTIRFEYDMINGVAVPEPDGTLRAPPE
jgi:hypothetical protein